MTTRAVWADTTWSLSGGAAYVAFDPEQQKALGLTAELIGAADPQQLNHLAITADSTLQLVDRQGAIVGPVAGEMLTDEQLVIRGAGSELVTGPLSLARIDNKEGSIWVIQDGAEAIFELRDTRLGMDQAAAKLLIEAGELAITPYLAQALGDESLAGQSLGGISIEATLTWQAGDAPLTAEQQFENAQQAGVRAACGNPGPDVIVNDLTGISNYSAQGSIEAFSVGTDSCNVGNTPIQWISSNNQHPVIGQNMYRLKNGRFEQVGQSWLKHGFTALADDLCNCNCQDPGTGALLGVGCTDPYVSSLNGSQNRMGPRFEVNAYTGYYPYPATNGSQTGNSIYKRLQVNISDLDPAQSGGGTYYVEGQYVTADDAAAKNQDNNNSYRLATVSGSGTAWNANIAGTTVRQQAAIRAWSAADASVELSDVRVPGEGLLILGAKVTDLGGGVYHYEYAIQNINSDRSVGGVQIPVDSTANVTSIGFHDVFYHSGEPFAGDDWSSGFSGGQVSWATTPYNSNANANALRWGTLYNFRFNADRPPRPTIVRMNLFKPGTPSYVLTETIGPDPGVLDCNSNGVDDVQDIAGGTSSDCNGNGAPDECESFPTSPLALQVYATGFSSPVGLYHVPGDRNRVFVIEQNSGLIKIIQNGSVLGTPFLNIASLISNGGERGLLGLAFDPNYATNGFFYVNYTNLSGNTVIARYTVSANPNIANAASAVILKTITQDFANHNGGSVVFGPDGYLYVGMGDGGSGGDPNNRAQDLNSLLGKILRLDVNNPPTYVAAGNPYIGVAGADEIWSYGTRNPWRITFDRQTGDLWIADVGQNLWEEIDVQPAGTGSGANYGWRCYEGNAPYNTSGCGPASGMVFPVSTYGHTGGACSITGGYVYRGCDIPDLQGTYFFADYCANFIHSIRYKPGDAIPPAVQDRTTELGPVNGSIVSFGEDDDGEMYIVTSGGYVYKIVSNPTVALCGNAALDGTEECDDGNHENGDGCSSVCQLEADNNDFCANAQNICPGVYTGSTLNATVDGSTTCGTSNSSKDVWYHYVPTADGQATFSLCGGASFDTVMSIHAGCPGATGNSLACSDDNCGTTGGPSAITYNVVAGESYYIRVSGFQGASGSFKLSVDGPPCVAFTCGNGSLEPGEECEPPGTTRCDDSCQKIPCDVVLFDDNFETDKGWTTSSTGAVSGFWERGVPVNDTSWAYDPISDSDGSGRCYLTLNQPGNSDVDNGSVTLTSPTIDMTEGNVTIAFDYYLYLTSAGDSLTTEINSNNGVGAWTQIAQATTSGSTSWRHQVITPATLAGAGVSLTSTMKIRFTAVDGDPQGQVEAGIDAVRITAPCRDCDSNGYDDRDELAAGSATDCNANNVIDVCDIAAGTSTDCDGGPVGVVSGGDDIVNTFCFGCHNTDGGGGPGFPGPSLRNHDRIFIRNMLTPPTTHPGGAHPEFTWQSYADLEAFLSDIGGRARPDLVPDECQSFSDCNSNGVADGCDLGSHAAVDLNQNGVLDVCEGLCSTTIGDVDADCDADLSDFAAMQRCYTGNVGAGTILYAAGCACLDADGDGDVDDADFVKIANALNGPGAPAPGCVP